MRGWSGFSSSRVVFFLFFVTTSDDVVVVAVAAVIANGLGWRRGCNIGWCCVRDCCGSARGLVVCPLVVEFWGLGALG